MARKKLPPQEAAQPTLLLEFPTTGAEQAPRAQAPALPGPVATGPTGVQHTAPPPSEVGQVVLINLDSIEVPEGFSATGSLVVVGAESEGGEVLEERSQQANMASRLWAEAEVLRRLLDGLDSEPANLNQKVRVSTRATEVVGQLVANLPSWERAHLLDPENSESHFSPEAKTFWKAVLESLKRHQIQLLWIAPNSH